METTVKKDGEGGGLKLAGQEYSSGENFIYLQSEMKRNISRQEYMIVDTPNGSESQYPSACDQIRPRPTKWGLARSSSSLYNVGEVNVTTTRVY